MGSFNFGVITFHKKYEAISKNSFMDLLMFFIENDKYVMIKNNIKIGFV